MSISNIKIQEADNSIKVHNIVSYSGICESAADAVEKVVDLPGFILEKGTEIIITFKYRNMVEEPTLEVNKTGPKPILFNNEKLNAINEYWTDGAFTTFLYDGTNWNLIDTIAGDDADSKVRIYRHTEGYDNTYPVMISKTSADKIGEKGKDTSYASTTGMFVEDKDGEPTIRANPATGTLYATRFEGQISGNEMTGTVPISNGGTGATNETDARIALGIQYGNQIPVEAPSTGEGSLFFFADTDISTLPIAEGGTGATSAAEALENFGIADYIVEQGTSGIWAYRKWKNGRAECWTTSEQSVTGVATTAVMGGYYTYALIDLPFSFETVQNVMASGRTGTGIGFASGSYDNPKIRIAATGNQNSTNIKFQCVVHGTYTK